jgi:hypothetical protein
VKPLTYPVTKKMEFDESSKMLLKYHGFHEYKKKQYVLIKNDIVFYLNFQGRKNDIYLWFAIYPLSLPNIWFGCGFGKCSGRIPEKEKSISISSESEIQKISDQLKNIVANELIPRFEATNNLRDIADLYLPSYAAGFAYLAMGEFEKGIKLLKEYVVFKKSLSDLASIEDEVKYFIDNATKEEISNLLDIEKTKNIKKLRLRKYL